MLSPSEIKILLDNHASWSYRPGAGLSRQGRIPEGSLNEWLQFLAELQKVIPVQGSWRQADPSTVFEVAVTLLSSKVDDATYALWKIDTEIAFLRARY